MKNIIYICFSVLLLVFLFGGNAYAQSSTGGTVINATVSGVWVLNLSLQYPEIIIPEDYYFYENLTVFQSNSQNISLYLNKTDSNDFVKFINITSGGTYYQDDYTLYLPVNTYENITLRVYVPPDMGFDGGTYDIPIYVYSLNDYRSNVTTLKIHVNTTNPIDDIQILNIYPSSLYLGESLSANISMHKIYPSETTDMQICYCINPNPNYQCGPAYNNYGCEWKAITEWLNYTKTVTVNDGPGSYYFIVAVKYPGDGIIKRAVSPGFLVKRVPGPPGGGGPGGVIPPQPGLNIISSYYLEAVPGERVNFEVEVKNTGSADATSTSLNIYGIPENWFSITPSQQDIGAGESKNYSISVYLPIQAHEQIYSLSVVAKSGTAESTRIITLTVAATLKNQAKFLLDDAQSKKKDAEEIIGKAKGWGMDTTWPEKTLADTNAVLEETKGLLESGDYEEATDKAKQAIDGYKSVISFVKGIVEKAYLLILEDVRVRLKNIENLTEEKDVIDSIKDKIDRSTIFHRQGRTIEAYRTILDARQLLVQMEGKLFFRDLVQNVIIISILIVVVIAISMVVFYKKRMSGFLKTIRIEEHKKNLKRLFSKEVRPSFPQKEKPDRKKLNEIRRLLDTGESSVDTDTVREVYSKVRNIYNSMSSEEKRMMKNDAVRITRLYNRIVRESH